MARDEDVYIKRLTFYLLLAAQTVAVAGFVISDHVELRTLKEIQLTRTELDLSELKRWANEKMEASIADRANLRLELLKTGELKYSLDQCLLGIKNLEQELKEHEKETNNRAAASQKGN